MAIKTITLAANAAFKYKLSGDVSLTTLQGGVTHTLLVEEGSTIEFSSSTVVSSIKIGGDVKTINIATSAIDTLSDSFRDTHNLEHVAVSSSVPITDMSNTFEGSSVKTFSIDTSKVKDFDSTFKDTTRLVEVDIDTTEATTMNDTFSGALSLQAIRHILPYNGLDLRDTLKDVTTLTELGGIDYTYVQDAGTIGNSPVLTELGLHLKNGKPQLRKLYLIDTGNVANPNYTFEMDYEFNNDDIVRRTVQINKGTPSTDKDNGYTFEMDYEFNNDGNKHRTLTAYDVDKFSLGILDNSIDTAYTLEMDIVPDYTTN